MRDGQTEPVLRLDGVARRFGGLVAVDGVSLSLGPRQRLAVIGPNGAGKTTLFRLIAGDMAPSAGRISLFGRDVTRMPAHRRARMGLSRTFQVSNLFSGLSVLDNVRLAVQARQLDRWRFLAPIRQGDRIGTAAMDALERVGIGPETAWPISPTASSASSRSPWPWRPSPASCCSTSRPRACRQRSGAGSVSCSSRCPGRFPYCSSSTT
jgi:ABC-type branched-subunit amino acid transport system ATPase component